ncbi:hypothetical protein BH10PLA2_BH10PLA2_30950 [soil metagenome]
MSARMATKAAGLALLLLTAHVHGQETPWQIPTPAQAQPMQATPSLHFTKQPNQAMPVSTPSSQPAPAIGRSRWENRPAISTNPTPARPDATTPASLQQTGFQQKYTQPALPRWNTYESTELLVPLEPPGRQRLFRLDSEAELFERMRQEGRERSSPERITFPEEPIISKLPHVGRSFPSMALETEPNYVLYRKLFFEERNSERYGWDLGVLNPFVSAGAFYWDLALVPYQFASLPLRRFDSNAGLCLPGDPVPYRLYPPNMSLTGAVVEAGVVVALFAIFP